VFNAARPAELPERSIILDLKELSYAPSRLRFELASGDFNSAVELRGSEDLTVWKSLGRQTLARYGASLEQLVLELPAASAYLLIRPEKPLPEILSLSAEFNTISLPEKIRESRFPPRGGGRELVYDTGGFYPLCSIDLLLSEADFYDVRIESRSYEDEPWRYESSGPVYRFNEHDTARRNRAFELDRPARYWRVSASGEAPFTSAPALVLRWEPRELIFLGRGRGPWTLACGNRDFEPVQGMLSLSGGETLSAAEAGGLRYTQRQTTLKKNSLYQVWILWGSLIFSALVLTALALYIARSMNKQKER
jgi:hypothetical protein